MERFKRKSIDMMKGITKEKILNMSIYCIYIISYLIIVRFFEKREALSDLKHYILLICLAVSGFILIFKLIEKNIKLKGNNIIYILLVGGIFIILSLIKMIDSEERFQIRSLVQTFLFVGPLLYAFVLINLFSKEDIIVLLKITTFIFIIFYFTEKNHTIGEFFKIANWRAINIVNFYGFIESHICSESFLQLFLFFYYIKYYKKDMKVKNINLYIFLNGVFTILSFKRLAILLVIAIIIGRRFIEYDKEISKKKSKLIYIFLPIAFVIMTILYTHLLSGDIKTSININKFSTNRDWLLSLWRANNYYSYGYGTSIYVIGRYLEMDLIQIYLELGWIPLFLFVFAITKLAYRRYYSMFIILYVLFNLLTASTMPWTTGWLILGLNLFTISNEKLEIKKGENDEKDIINNFSQSK